MRTSLVLAAAIVLALAVTASAHWDETEPAKWVQMPDLDFTGMDVNCTEPWYLLADDFLCTETGPILDVHIWGSWWQDHLPDGDPHLVSFTLSIHADIPESLSAMGYSMPGAVLWLRHFGPDEFTVRVWADSLREGWLEPPDGYDPLGDTICWQYNFDIPESVAFYQYGSPDLPIVYWLDVQAHPFDQNSLFGWKTSLDHWNDDAVYGWGPEPYDGPWFELIYPSEHIMWPESIDLAFVITGEHGPTYKDWGDAPDPTYPTLSANFGASHTIVAGFQMGMLIDAEPDGIPHPNALGDDMNNMQDEDGVMFTSPIIPGGTATVDVDMSFSLGGVLDAWLDFDGDGGWGEFGDRIFAGVPLAGGLINNLSFPVPASARPGVTYARFRLSQNGVASFTGAAPDGEVEDYEVVIEVGEEWKWFQQPDLDDTGIDINGTEPFILADDYLCDAPGRLTEIYIWSSWMEDHIPMGEDPNAVDFTLSIHADIPADTAAGIPHSMPGDVLWVRDFAPGEFTAEIWQDQIWEGWMDPPDGYVFPGDTICWLYTFFVPPHEAFHQTGMPDSAIVYWLDVQARPHDIWAIWGWKTSPDHWNDDAVWGQGMEPYPGPWDELRYPPDHAWPGQSIDLAFGLRMSYGTGVPDEITPESYRLRQNAPNPFNPRTRIRYDVPAGGGHVEIRIVDVAGRLVRTLLSGHQTEGEKSVEWDGRDEVGSQMATGVYFYHLTAPGTEASKKMLLLK